MWKLSHYTIDCISSLFHNRFLPKRKVEKKWFQTALLAWLSFTDDPYEGGSDAARCTGAQAQMRRECVQGGMKMELRGRMQRNREGAGAQSVPDRTLWTNYDGHYYNVDRIKLPPSPLPLHSHRRPLPAKYARIMIPVVHSQHLRRAGESIGPYEHRDLFFVCFPQGRRLYGVLTRTEAFL